MGEVKKATTVVVSYSLSGKLEKIYPSARNAAASFHVFSRTIDKAIREGKIIHQKQWRRMPINDIPNTIEPYEKKTSILSIRPIAEIDGFNEVINAYPSIKNASIINQVDPHTIRDVLKGKTKTANGKKYRYLSDEEIEQFGLKKGREISVK